jgi:protoporphyrin/coproporphyrin ferrochelatase
MSAGSTAVLMMGYGGPTSFAEVRPFVENIVRGRNVPQERIDAVVEQYRIIGGKSPFNQLTREQADALEIELSKKALPMPVHTGMLFWPPYIKDAISQISAQGVKKIVCIIMAPHRTEASFDRYRQAVSEAILEHSSTELVYIEQWHEHPLFIEAMAERLQQALEKLQDPQRQTQVMFTAHSVPEEMSEQSGYADQIYSTAKLIAEKLQLSRWVVAYQSRSGNPRQPWLEPDVKEVIDEVSRYGYQQVAVAPIGFVCDHVEVLYDLDVQAAEVAAKWGTAFARAGTVGNHPKFIRMLGELVQSVLES